MKVYIKAINLGGGGAALSQSFLYMVIYVHIYIYSVLDIFTMLFLGSDPGVIYHIVLCNAKLITLVVIATGPGLPVFWVFTATLL